MDAYYTNGAKTNTAWYRDDSCPNSFVKLRIIRKENSIEVVNDGGPRLNEISGLSVDVEGAGTSLLGNEQGSSVTIPVPDQLTEVTITARRTNGASWKVAAAHIGAYRREDGLVADIYLPDGSHNGSTGDVRRSGGCHRCGRSADTLLRRAGSHWWVARGGYTGSCLLMPPPGGLSICSDCGDGVCNTSTGENRCNCNSDCS